jgi:tetratricopeptide (TPR) repeat protein
MYAVLQARCRLSPGILAATVLALTAGTLLAMPVASKFDDLPAPFVAGEARNEAQVDRIEALAHFAAGRTFQQRGDFAQAVQQYAQADRLDPTATAARSNLVVAAVQGKLVPLAARYALKGIDPHEVGDLILGRVAIYLTEQGDLAHALEFYEKALAVSHPKGDAAETEGATNAEDASDIFTRFELGRLYHLTQKHAKAAEQFARVNEALEHPDRFGINEPAKKLLLGGDPAECYELFGEAFLLSDRFAEAEAAFRKAQAVAPQEAVLKFNLARIALRRGKAQDALAGLQLYLDRGLTSEGSAPYQLLADALKKLGKENELLDRLEKLHAADPTNAPLSYFLADQYLQAGRTEKAERLYLELSSATPTMLAYRNLAEIYRKSRQYEKLLALLGKLMATAGTLEVLGPEAKPLTTDARLFAKLVEAGRKEARTATAKVEFNEFYVLGMLAQEHKQHATANEFYELALNADPTKAAEVFLSWGIGELIDERPAEAVKIFQRGLDMKVAAVPAKPGPDTKTGAVPAKPGPDTKTGAAPAKPAPDKKAPPEGNPVFQYYLSGALAACDRFEPALAAARAAEKQKSDSARFASRLPWILFRAKRYGEARQAYEKLFARFGDEKDSLETLAVLREARESMSALCVFQGRLDEAEEWLQQVLDEYPDDVGANNDLGYLWADQNKHLDRALKMITAAVAAEPENRAYRDSLGWVFYRLGRFPEAVAELEKAVDEKQPDGTILDHLGDAYEKLGRHSQAVKAWQRAKAALEKEKELEKAEKVQEKMGK